MIWRRMNLYKLVLKHRPATGEGRREDAEGLAVLLLPMAWGWHVGSE